MKKIVTLLLVLATHYNVNSQNIILGEKKSFPTAMGLGKYAGVNAAPRSVCHVTNVNDSGSGSLRSCLDGNISNRDIVFFNTTGNIMLTSDWIESSGDNIRLLGQTSSGGIAIVSDWTEEDNLNAALMRFSGDDIVTRHWRLRRKGEEYSTNNSGMTTLQGNRVIHDHVSVGGISDDLVGAGWMTVQNYTFQRGMITYSVEKQNTQGKGVLLFRNISSVDFLENVLAHLDTRNPNIYNALQDADTQFISNIVYNRGILPAEINAGSSTIPNTGAFLHRINFVNNKYISGSNTSAARRDVLVGSNPSNTNTLSMYISGNDLLQVGTVNNDWDYVGSGLNPFDTDLTPNTNYRSLTAHNLGFDLNSALGSDDLIANVLPYAGAIEPIQDSWDSQIESDVVNGTGSIYKTPSTSSNNFNNITYPTLNAVTTFTDTNNNWVDDAFETAHSITNVNDKPEFFTLNGNTFDNREYENGTWQRHEYSGGTLKSGTNRLYTWREIYIDELAGDYDSNYWTGAVSPTPTCTDGIQNGDETGVDCGGSCPNACSTPSTNLSNKVKKLIGF